METPSKIRDEYWVHATNDHSKQEWTDWSGKWLLFVSFQKLDQHWKLIAEETVLGRPGIASKAATAQKTPLAKNPWVKVICVYTYDSRDDVRRVRQRLREIGFEKKLSFKTDQATQQGAYSTNSDKPVSLLYE